MAKRRAKDFDLTTPCTLCGYKIPPNELMRTSFSKANCPQCKREFEIKMPDHPQRTS